MSWALGWDKVNLRDIGYGVPAMCDLPGCEESIDRGMGYICGGAAHMEDGCGFFFCLAHLGVLEAKPFMQDASSWTTIYSCDHEILTLDPTFRGSPDTDEWVQFKLRDPSWALWRGKEHGWWPALGQASGG